MKLYLSLLLVITCSYPSLCLPSVNENCTAKHLIYACESEGGGKELLFVDGSMKTFNLTGNVIYYNTNLNTITIYHDGYVDFNNGPLSIAVFNTNLTKQPDYDTHFLYDSNSTTNRSYYQQQYVELLLENASVGNFNLTEFFVVTWKLYVYCNETGDRITFQLAVASTSTNTYALFFYDGEGECNPSVTTGFKRDDGGYMFPILKSGDVSSLWEESNVGIGGVYIYEINEKPRALHETPPAAVERDIRIEPSGLLEVRRNGEWGSVCDDYWTDRDADVACRQLGHLGYGAKAACKGKFPRYQMVKLYMMDDVHCNGDENSLFECTHKEKDNCRNRERAGVNCITKDDIGIRFWKDTKGQKTGGVIQLHYKGDWRFVCDHMWTVKDAQVACRQLKLPCSNAQPCFDDEETDENTTEYWMDYVNCDGDEEALFACSHMGLGVSHDDTCNGETKAGVICN